MSSPYIRLSRAAIKAKLTQNEGLIFHALMIQTLGYRKTKDNLTDKRLAQLSGIRLDHFRVALASFLQHDLFYRIEHPSYDYQYHICDEFLDDEHTTMVYPPSLPKSGEAREVRGNLPEVGADSPQTLVDLPEVGGHTTENLNIKKPQQQTTDKTNTEKTKKNKQHEPQTTPLVSVLLAGLEALPEQVVIESSQPIRLEFSAKDIGKAIPATEQKSEQVTENVIEKKVDTPPVSTPIAEPMTESIAEPNEPFVAPSMTPPMTQTTTADSVAKLAQQVTSQLSENHKCDANEANTTKPQDPVVVVEKEVLKPCRPLPDAIDQADRPACQRHFDQLTDQQQRDVLTVFAHNLKTGTIKSTTRYFISLTQLVRKNGLTLPSKKKPSSPSSTAIASPYTPEAFAIAKEKDKERQRHAELWSDYCWLQQQTIVQNKPKKVLATQMGMEEAYHLFNTSERDTAVAI